MSLIKTLVLFPLFYVSYGKLAVPKCTAGSPNVSSIEFLNFIDFHDAAMSSGSFFTALAIY
jgi:hypothetical protein